jgi:hypothetical protein
LTVADDRVVQSRQQWLHWAVMLLLTLVVCQAMLVSWLFVRVRARSDVHPAAAHTPWRMNGNPLPALFPQVDFRRIYPGLSQTEIDELQSEGIAVRFLFSPFVQFEPMPVKGRFIEVTSAGYRSDGRVQPWPPRRQDLVFFVFGGSTTFCYGLRNEETLVRALQNAFAGRYPGERVECYNFGRGYYFSSQERILFEQLLLQGIRPDVAVFVDGLNDFYFWEGRPWLTRELSEYMAPDLVRPPARLSTDAEQAAAVESVSSRYAANVRLIEAVARDQGVSVLFVGQPVPWFEFPINATTHPFGRAVFVGHELCLSGYPRFRERALAGAFGPRHIWCGDAFADASAPMYADSIHYSPAGARRLANLIAARATERGLLPVRRTQTTGRPAVGGTGLPALESGSPAR